MCEKYYQCKKQYEKVEILAPLAPDLATPTLTVATLTLSGSITFPHNGSLNLVQSPRRDHDHVFLTPNLNGIRN